VAAIRPGGWLSRLVQSAAGQKPRSARPDKAAERQRVVTRIERSVTTTWLPSRRKKRKTTVEWRHGNCQVRHRSQQAAQRCTST
jgi:hypothetical protein